MIQINPASAPWLEKLLVREAHDGICVCSKDWKYPERPCDQCAAFDLLTQISAEWKRGLAFVEKENAS